MYREERAKLATSAERTKRDVQRDLSERKIAGVIAMVEAGGDARTMAARLNELEAQHVDLERRRPGKAKDVVSLHPNAGAAYAEIVGQMQKVLGKGQDSDQEFVEIVRDLIQRIVATPDEPGKPMKLDLVGNLTALLSE